MLGAILAIHLDTLDGHQKHEGDLLLPLQFDWPAFVLNRDLGGGGKRTRALYRRASGDGVRSRFARRINRRALDRSERAIPKPHLVDAALKESSVENGAGADREDARLAGDLISVTLRCVSARLDAREISILKKTNCLPSCQGRSQPV
jgi:hypothetical protein